MDEPVKRWSSQVEAICLLHPLKIRISGNNQGWDVFSKSPKIVGSGNTIALALQMFFDHLLIDYYEYSLNPGTQNIDDEIYGKRLKKLFNTASCQERRKLLDFHGDGP